MGKLRIGIDVGSDGALSIFKDDQLLKYSKIPKVSDELDMRGMIDIIMAYWMEGDSIHAVLEDLHSIFGTSASSNFSFGVNNGLIVGALQAMQIPYTKVQAKKWQKEMWEGIRPVEILVKGKKDKPAPTKKDGSPKYKIDTKATSLVAARRLFPKETFLATERSKVPHDGIVDAVLIGLFATRNY